MKIHSRASRRGMTLPEVLMALAISGSLLVAAAWATDVSIRSYGQNVRTSELAARGRLALNRIESEIRSASEHRPGSSEMAALFAAGQTVSGDSIRYRLSTGQWVLLAHDTSTRVITRQIDAETPATIVTEVDAFTLSLRPAKSATAIRTGGAYDLLESAGLSLALRISGENGMLRKDAADAPLVLTTSVVPRGAFW